MTSSPPFARNDPRYAQMLNAIFARAVGAHRAGRLDEAATLYKQVLSYEKRQFDAMHMLAVVAGQQGDLAEGVRLLTKAIRENPNSADAYLNLGRMQGELGDNNDAVRNLKKSIALAPNNHLAHSNLSAALRQIGASDEALAAADRAVALNGQDASCWINRGNVLLERGSYEEARQCYLKARSLPGGNDAKVWIGLGTTNFYLMQHQDALAAYDEARKTTALTPDAAALRLMCKAQLCDWRDIARERGEIIAALRQKKPLLPLATIAIADSPADQLLSMRSHIASKFPKVPQAPRPRRAANERIGIAYLSGDFNQHPVGILTAGLFETARPRAIRDLRAVERQRRRQRAAPAHHGRLRSLHRHREDAGHRHRRTDPQPPDRYPRRPCGLHARVAAEFARAARRAGAGDLSRLSRHHGRALYRLHHRRRDDHSDPAAMPSTPRRS